MEHDEVRIQPPDPRQKRLFYLASGTAIAVVAAGWFLSFQGMLANTHVDSSAVQAIGQLTTGVKNVTEDVKAKTAEPVAETGASLNAALSPAAEGVQQREDALNAVTSIMKEQIESPSSSTTTPQP